MYCDSKRYTDGSLVTKQDTLLTGHVRRTLLTTAIIAFSYRCLNYVWCISINYQYNTLPVGKCKLNDMGVLDSSSGKSNQFIHEDNYIFSQLRSDKVRIMRECKDLSHFLFIRNFFDKETHLKNFPKWSISFCILSTVSAPFLFLLFPILLFSHFLVFVYPCPYTVQLLSLLFVIFLFSVLICYFCYRMFLCYMLLFLFFVLLLSLFFLLFLLFYSCVFAFILVFIFIPVVV